MFNGKAHKHQQIHRCYDESETSQAHDNTSIVFLRFDSENSATPQKIACYASLTQNNGNDKEVCRIILEIKKKNTK